MKISLPQFPDAQLLTNSSEQTYKTCARKFFLSYRLGIRPAYPSEPLRLGAAFHIGIEACKMGGDDDTVETAVRNAYLDNPRPPYLSEEEYAVEEETAVAMALAWSRKWRGDMILNYVAVETGFDLQIINPATRRPTPCFRSAGKIDGIAELPDGRLAVIEHKTVGEALDPASDYWKRLLLDNQISRYVMAAQAMGYKVETTIYDCTRKPQIKPRKLEKKELAAAVYEGYYHSLKLEKNAKGDYECPERETPKMYGARLLADMQARPDFYFARNEVPRLAADLEAFQAEQWVMQRTIREADLDTEHFGIAAWPRNTGACVSPYRCTYLDICRGLQGNPTEQIPDGFKRVDRLHQELPDPATA